MTVKRKKLSESERKAVLDQLRSKNENTIIDIDGNQDKKKKKSKKENTVEKKIPKKKSTKKKKETSSNRAFTRDSQGEDGNPPPIPGMLPQIPSLTPELDGMFSNTNPLIELAQNLNTHLDSSKIKDVNFGSMIDIQLKTAYFLNLVSIQQIPEMFARQSRLSKFTHLLEDNLFSQETFNELSTNQKIQLLGMTTKAINDNATNLIRNTTTVHQGMESIPKLASFSEDYEKKSQMNLSKDDEDMQKQVLQLIRGKIAEKAKDRDEFKPLTDEDIDEE